MKSPWEIKTALESEFEKISSLYQAFIKDHAVSSILLVACAIIAVIPANSSLTGTFNSCWYYWVYVVKIKRETSYICRLIVQIQLQ